MKEVKVGVKVNLKTPEDFLLIKETLTRIGIANTNTKTLYQSCHLLSKRNNYYVVHFKEMFLLDGKKSSFDKDDLQRRNLIAGLLEDWGLLTIENPSEVAASASVKSIKILPYSERADWNLVQKYTIGTKTKHY